MRVKGPHLRVSRRAAWGAGAAAMLAISGASWLGITAWAAHNDLNAVRAGVEQIRAHVKQGDVGAARATANEVAGRAARAHRLTDMAPWAIASRVPGLGSPLRTIRGISAAADELGSVALPNLLTAGSALDPGQSPGPGVGVDVAALQRAEPAIDAAAASIDRAAAITADLPRSTWLGAADRARADINDKLERMTVMAAQARDAAPVLPQLLGSDRPKLYFLAFQNLAEARGTGGLPGAFAIVQAENGRVKFLQFENDDELHGVSADVDLGRDYNQLYGGGKPETLYLNSNLSPHFPDAARIWTSMWQHKTGQQLDGAVAVDPVVLSYLLAVTGPAPLPDGSTVSADNVVALTQNTAYFKFGDDVAGRKQYLLQVAKAAAEKVSNAHGNAVGLGRALARAAAERRLLVWSADPQLEKGIARTSLAGVVPRTVAPYAGLTIINSGGNKLDYYLDRALDWERMTCGNTSRVQVTIRLRNDVPPGMTHGYVTDRSDHPPYPVQPGDNRVMLFYAATDGAKLRFATLDGQRPLVISGREQGHPVFVIDVELPQRQQRTVVLEFDEPRADGAPIVLQQPLIRPMQANVREIPCTAAVATGSRP